MYPTCCFARILPDMEKPEALTPLRWNVINKLNIRTPDHLHCQPESARSGQVVRFFQLITYLVE